MLFVKFTFFWLIIIPEISKVYNPKQPIRPTTFLSIYRRGFYIDIV